MKWIKNWKISGFISRLISSYAFYKTATQQQFAPLHKEIISPCLTKPFALSCFIVSPYLARYGTWELWELQQRIFRLKVVLCPIMFFSKFNLIIFKVLKNFQVKRVQNYPNSLKHQWKISKAECVISLEKTNPGKETRNFSRDGGFHWSQQGPAGFAVGKLIHSQVIADRFWRKPSCRGWGWTSKSPNCF